MNENLETIRESIRVAVEYQKKHLQHIRNNAPIFNSLVMLNQLIENLNSKSYLLLNLNRLNVGLLAAKSLDFEGESSELYICNQTPCRLD